MNNNEVPAIPFPASAVLWLYVREQSKMLHQYTSLLFKTENKKQIRDEKNELSLSSASERAVERKVSGSNAKR